MLSCLTKLEKLLCLKRRGSRTSAKTCGSHTTKLLPAGLHDTTWSVDGSPTRSYVLVRNGGGPASCSPSIGRGSPAAPTPPSCSRSSSFTMPPTTGSMTPNNSTKDPLPTLQAQTCFHRRSDGVSGYFGYQQQQTRARSFMR